MLPDELDKLAEGLKQGRRSGYSRLQPDQVREIRELRMRGVTFRALAERYRVTPAAIKAITDRRSYKDIK